MEAYSSINQIHTREQNHISLYSLYLQYKIKVTNYARPFCLFEYRNWNSWEWMAKGTETTWKKKCINETLYKK